MINFRIVLQTGLAGFTNSTPFLTKDIRFYFSGNRSTCNDLYLKMNVKSSFMTSIKQWAIIFLLPLTCNISYSQYVYDLVPYLDGRLYGFADLSGNVVIKPDFEEVKPSILWVLLTLYITVCTAKSTERESGPFLPWRIIIS